MGVGRGHRRSVRGCTGWRETTRRVEEARIRGGDSLIAVGTLLFPLRVERILVAGVNAGSGVSTSARRGSTATVLRPAVYVTSSLDLPCLVDDGREFRHAPADPRRNKTYAVLSGNSAPGKRIELHRVRSVSLFRKSASQIRAPARDNRARASRSAWRRQLPGFVIVQACMYDCGDSSRPAPPPRAFGIAREFLIGCRGRSP